MEYTRSTPKTSREQGQCQCLTDDLLLYCVTFRHEKRKDKFFSAKNSIFKNSTVHWIGACANDHALISCTIDEQLLSYQDPWARDPGGRTGAIKAKKIDPKQIPRIQSKLDAIMRPIAQQIITDINEGKCIKEVGLRGVVESRVATAGMLMHKNPLGRDNRARERGPHRSQEQVEILKELATLIAARTTRGRPGRASVAVQQCMTQFGLYSDFKMTPQEVKRVANLPEWTTVLEVMIKSRREDLAFRTTKQERWNQRAGLNKFGLSVVPGSIPAETPSTQIK